LAYLLLGILYVGIYLGAGALLGTHPLAELITSSTMLVLLAGTVCAIIAWRRRDWEGTHRLFWDAIGAGMAMWSIGQIGFTFTSVTVERSWVQWHTMFSLCGGIGPVVALFARPYLGVRKSNAFHVAVDLISYAMLIGFVFAYFIMVPSVVPVAGPSPQATLLALVQIQRLVLFSGFAIGIWLAWETPWRDTYARLTIGTGIGFFLRLVTSGAIATDRYREGTFFDLAWIVPFMCYAWAAAKAPSSASTAEDAPPSGGWRGVVIATAPVLLIPLIGFGLLRVQPIGDPGDSFRLLLTTLAMVAGLGLLTLRLSVQSSELQRADARVRLLAAATEQTADLILITRADGAVEHANDACVQALGYSREELSTMMLPQLLEHGFERMVGHVGSEVRTSGIWRGTLIHRRKDGTTFPASSTVVALRNREGRILHFVGVQRDITDELRLRDQLVHSERLSAVGELVAGVAHEINNPLQTIIGCVELMLEEARPAGHERDLELVRQEATRAGQIVRNLLSFVRRGTPNRTSADLNQLARAVAELREHHLVQNNIKLELDLHPGVLPVLVNREEIQQIILNLVLNAEHALGDSPGSITIRTDAGEHAHSVQVIDDGPGVSQELRGRVFEPFFTTKEVGQGTGLGLSIALGIATAHGGSLQLVERPKGACFQLTLPVHAAIVPPERKVADAQAVDAPQESSRRRALVVEDERPIRALLTRMLERRGYDVAEAGSVAEARDASDGKTFDLVLCDVRLGDGSGVECLRDLRTKQPDLDRRFVFVTGDVVAQRDAHDTEGIPILTKPFTAADLDRLLAEIEILVG
jgi:PAS domain S-box-containing protein